MLDHNSSLIDSFFIKILEVGGWCFANFNSALFSKNYNYIYLKKLK